MKNEIIAFYEELYQSKEQRKDLNNSEFLDKIATIIKILLNQNYTNEEPIWKPKSESLDCNGFSQKEIEKIIRGRNLQEEIIKFQNLFAMNYNTEGNADIFIHRASRTILFKKKSNIRGGTDIRIINILPAWLIILEKLAQVKIKNILTPKLSNFQFGFRENSDCNLAKILVWYNNSKLGYKKQLLIDIQKAFDSINRQKLKEMLENDFKGEEKEIIIDFLDLYENINYNILGKMLHPTKGGPQGSSLVPMLFCYYIEKAISNQILNSDYKIQLYADGIIIQTKTLDELSNSYHRIKENLERIDLTINTEKCEIISDDSNDIIKDNTNGQLIMPKKNAKYLGQIINSGGLTENIIENKIFRKLINVLQRFKGFAKTIKIRIFKTYLISKVNHLLPLISLTGNIEISWKCIRKIIFRNILNCSTLPLETAMSMGIGYYNIIIRPLVRLVERYDSFRRNNEETKFIKDATTKALLFWLQTEKKHQEQEKEMLQKIATNEIWVNIKDLDNILYRNHEKRLMKNNESNIKINNIDILKFPNINYDMSNAPYHEIIDTAIIRESNKSDKEKDIKYERMLELTKQIIIGKEITLLLDD